ncbi:hypothetical protein [Ruminococcus albus]|uniref:O-antigen ligase like membrane protein n=1 Tax=Ruminococcus albus TaxID=1264 RepID=A0A1I1CUS8_RUMAL|nr:hypothetical protein [Ruminococcus albus]SFB66297.1 hypothetical protein SAMN02910406_00035 [Ruminococcus albus]
MNKVNQQKNETVLTIISIIFAIYLSGNYFVMSKYDISVLLFLLFEIIIFLLIKKGRIKYEPHWILFISITITVFFLSALTNNFMDISSYIAILLQMICAMIICLTVSKKQFEAIYVEIMVCLALISLIFYAIGFIYPSFVRYFPSESRSDLNLTYYNAYIYVYWEETGWTINNLSIRNSGIFWEPGVYQAYLNIALFLLLQNETVKYQRMKILVLVFTIITTLSATGLFVLFLVVTGYFVTNKQSKNILFLLLGFIIFIVAVSKTSFLTDKLFNSEYIKNRVAFNQLQFVFGSYKAYLWGYTFTGRENITTTIWNSIFDSALVFGIPYVLLLLYCYFRFCKKIKSGFFFYIVLIICFSVESLIWRPFFMLFIFYGISTNSSEEHKIVENVS